ncbi:MAG: hypothetical protein ACREJC_05105 [Tepidisphaeraceae bacterium]
MIGAIARHISIVAAFAGSLAAIVPGVLLWPRLSRSSFAGSLTPYFLLEMGVVGAIVLIAFLARKAISAPAVWVACGLTGAFMFVAGFTIGGLYLPATVLFVLSGVLGDVGERRHALRHLLLAVGAALVQSAVMAAVVAIG